MTAHSIENSRTALKAWVRALELTAPIQRNDAVSLPVLVDELAIRFGDAPALVGIDGQLTYKTLSGAANRYARWALAQGLRRGDVVGLLMQNCPDYLAIWLGLTRVGVVVSLLNTSLTGDLLAHSIRIVSPRHIIVSARLASALRTAHDRMPATFGCWVHGSEHPEWPRIDLAVAPESSAPLSFAECQPPRLDDRALFIYTSGTTGLPKAAIVSHFRIMQWSHWFAGMLDTRPTDRMYNCLPLYHSVGGVVATCATLVGGGAVVLRERFSATGFWRDLVAERCTLFQYIGELCRYLVNTPIQPEETSHQLRLCCGNGLRADVWDAFKNRFQIPQILEYYASTEGSFSLYNCEGRRGAIGRIPPFLAHRMPVALVKIDPATALPLRQQNGQCTRCLTNEIGEAIGEVSEPSGKQSGRFEGYADAEATKSKVLRDVFANGDAWYRSGDLMRLDEHGFFYFVDRVGDTYRWKGQNVSTVEVAAVVSACRGVIDAVVYGVLIPGTEGRVGMAALVVNSDFDLNTCRQYLAGSLPEYARPLFYRVVPAIEITDTFKFKKQDLVLQGYDPTVCHDQLYFDDQQRGSCVPLDAALFRQLQSGGPQL
jgi:fatty-acyl-CoA synthase